MATDHRHSQPAEAPQPPDSGRRGLRGPRERPVGPIRLTAAKTTTPARARNPPRTPALTAGGTFAKQPRGDAGVRADAARSPASDDLQQSYAASGSRPRSAVNSSGSRQGDGVGSLESCKDEEGGLRRETYRTAVGGDRRPDR